MTKGTLIAGGTESGGIPGILFRGIIVVEVLKANHL